MSDAKGQQEPSMEEILASIRRIIAEDSDAPATPASMPLEAPQHEEEDVLELTEMLHEPEPPPPPPPPPPAPRPVASPPPPPAVQPGLVSDQAAASAGAAFSALARKKIPTTDIPVGNGALTLEQLVRELLAPMLKDWLDQNLPSMVERIVQDEVRRISAQ